MEAQIRTQSELPNGRKLDALYRLAWERGLNHLLPPRAVGNARRKIDTEGTDGKLNGVSVGGGVLPAPEVEDHTMPMACAIDDPTCVACQQDSQQQAYVWR